VDTHTSSCGWPSWPLLRLPWNWKLSGPFLVTNHCLCVPATFQGIEQTEGGKKLFLMGLEGWPRHLRTSNLWPHRDGLKLWPEVDSFKVLHWSLTVPTFPAEASSIYERECFLNLPIYWLELSTIVYIHELTKWITFLQQKCTITEIP